MDTTDPFAEFLGDVAKLRDDNGMRVSAHTSSVSADAWTSETPTDEPPDETSTS